MLETGSILDGKYKILNVIGQGGMSVVYLAINERANKTWAVKEVRKDDRDSGILRRGLIAETEMLKKLDHPNLPSVVDVIDQEDSFIIVMDYIEGKSLLDVLEENGRQPVDTVVGWAMQLCDVLAYLHSRRPPVIYRDLKPANIMLRPNGQLALIDFGTAREYKYSGDEDTAWLGTRGYAAPEQFGALGQTDERTDIFNLGATLYHLITGQSPAESHFEFRPLGSILPELQGSGLEKVAEKCCRPDPRERYQNCSELMYALEHVHDEDDRAIRRRNLKWRCFMACVAVSLVTLAAGLGFRAAYTGSREEIYKKYMRDSFNAENFEKTAEACGAAMKILPEERPAWDRLAGALEELTVISDQDYTAVIRCMRGSREETGTGQDENLQLLKRRDPEAYADFNYRVGMAVFFNKESAGETCSREFFRNATETAEFSGPESSVAQTMYALADQYTKTREMEAAELCDDGRRIRGFEVESGYAECWSILEEMSAELTELEAATGNIGYPIAVCERIAQELLGENIARYASDGVSEKAMRSALKRAGEYLQGIDIEGQTENTQRRLREAGERIAQAQRSVDRKFSSAVGKMSEPSAH